MTSAPQEERPKRLSLSQIVELLLTKSPRARDSVSIGRTASGEHVWDVSAAAAEGETLEDVLARCQKVADHLERKYARQNHDHEQGEVSLTRNAKGETQTSVSMKTSALRPKLGQVEGEARKVYDSIRVKYPMADGLSAKPGSVT